MKKYYLIFTQSFSQFVAYRLQILLQIIQNSLPAIITLLVLTYAKSNSISSQSLISYYLLVTTTAPLAFSSIDDYLDNITESGEVNNYLVKPISLFKSLFIKAASEKFITLIFLLPLLISLLFYFKTNLNNLIWFPLILILSFALSHSFSYLVGLGCFWLDEYWPFRNLKHVTVQLLGGLVIPYSVFPNWLLKLINLTPFPYLVSWPGRVLQSDFTPTQLLSAIFWLILLLASCHLVQNSAIRHYSLTNS